MMNAKMTPMIPDCYSVVARVPAVTDYIRLRAAGGLSPFTPEAAEKGLDGSIFCCVVLFEDRIVGMGRLIGDGGCFFQIVDIVVEPDHQGHGLGKAIMSALMDHIRTALVPSAYVGLIADVPANRLYEQFGFSETAPTSVAMACKLK